MEYHVLTRSGDALRDVDAALERLGARGVDREGAGLHKAIFVARAEQTVVMVSSPDAPLAAELRGVRGWKEPGTG